MSTVATVDTVRFGDVVNEVKSHEKSPLENGVERVIGLEHLDPMSLSIKRWGDVRDGTTFTKRFEPGHVLFGKRRCYQKKAGVAGFTGICSGDIIVMAADPEHLLPGLLPFLVQSDAFFEWAEKTSSGSLSPRTKFKSLADFRFPLPPKDRQREILEVLQALEDSLRATEDAIEAAEQLNRSLMATLLTRGIGHTKFKQTEIGEIPEEWEVVELSCASERITVGVVNKPASYYMESGVPALRSLNIRPGGFDLSELKYFPQRQAEQSSLSLS